MSAFKHAIAQISLWRFGFLSTRNSSRKYWLHQMVTKKSYFSNHSYDALSMLAAQHDQWPIVSHFHMRHRLTTTTVNLLLHTAVNQVRLMPFVVMGNKTACDQLPNKLNKLFYWL